jgi:START domain
VKGVTARELCHFFFSPEFRMEWETTVEQATVLEKIAPDTLIFLQVNYLGYKYHYIPQISLSVSIKNCLYNREFLS